MRLLNIIWTTCSEPFSNSAEAWWPDSALIIYWVHWLVAWVAWQFDLIVLNDVLFDDSFSVSSELRLTNCRWIEISLGNESIVAWNMCGCLRRSHCQFMMLIVCSFNIWVQFVSWILPICAHGLCVFSVEVASLRAVGLAIDTPFRPCGLGAVLTELVVIDRMVVRFPMARCIAEVLASLL